MISIIPPAFADKGTFVDEIRFIQYLDENTALEEVRNGNLDMYYYRISSDRLEDSDSKEGLKVFIDDEYPNRQGPTVVISFESNYKGPKSEKIMDGFIRDFLQSQMATCILVTQSLFV